MKALFLTITLAMILSLLPCTAVMAGPAYNICFYPMDGNGDDSVSLDEFTAAIPGADQAVFHAADADQDNALTHEEWETYKQSQGMEDHHN